MLKKEFMKSQVILLLGIILSLLLPFLISGRFIFLDIFALVLGTYLVVESFYSYVHDNERPFIVYPELAVGSWLIGMHLFLIIFGRSFL